MLDINLLRKDAAAIAARLKTRGYAFDADRFNTLETERRSVQTKTEELQARRNALSKQIGVLRGKDQDATSLLAEAGSIPDEVKKLEVQLAGIQHEMQQWMLEIPNLLHESVPIGTSADDNVEVRRWGTPRPFDFPVKDHVDVGTPLGLDFDTAAKLSGARFTMLRGPLARLQRALAHFMLDVQTREHGYTECYTPYIVNADCLIGTTQLPKFRDEMFWVTKGGGQGGGEKREEMFLISTSEISLTNTVREEILSEAELPLKLTAHTPCFRSESGSYGKDTRGMIRNHQFEKVEIVQIVHPTASYPAHEQLVAHAEAVLQKLELPYRVMLLCAGDTSFGSAKTYDLEVWLPAQNTYREISSCSNFEAFQARRMQARFKNAQGKTEFVHTLNGSGLAVGRTLVALLENFQRFDGGVDVPHALRPYIDGASVLRPA